MCSKLGDFSPNLLHNIYFFELLITYPIFTLKEVRDEYFGTPVDRHRGHWLDLRFRDLDRGQAQAGPGSEEIVLDMNNG